MITDRLRMAAGSEHALVERVAHAASAGVDLVQVRERDLEGKALMQLVAHCVAATHGTRTRVLVNDRYDVALAAGAHGVHLRGDSMPAFRLRALSPHGFLIGRSVHSLDEIRAGAAEGADYVIFGAVFPTTSKPGYAARGVGALGDVVSATTVPVLAVGGVTLTRVGQLADTGCAGFAAIEFFAQSDGQRLRDDVVAASRAFRRP